MQIGQSAPDFTLVSDDKAEISLSSFKGNKNVLLLFFPQAFTGTCTNELHEATNNAEFFNSHNVQVIGISTDSPFTLAEYKKVNAFNFPLLSDHDAETAATYGTQYKKGEFPFGLSRVSRRSSFVIDTEGVVQYAEIQANAGELPNFAEIHAAIEKL
jgi:glutaredoxin-dependent peroxiredoxin